jgi:hypothetical protein
MKKPKAVSLSAQERQEFIEHINKCSLDIDDKKIVIELVDFCDDLIEKLKLSKISINKLKEMLVGLKADNLKKILQIH